MSELPRLLRGHAAIAEHLGMTARAVQHNIRQHSLPVMLKGGCPYATPAALDDWQALSRAGKLPSGA